MSSPLVLRLETELRESRDPAYQAELAARIACYHARVGELDVACRTRDELRQHYGDGHSPRVSILLMCLDALILYFRDLDPNARDRLARANLISVAFKERQLISYTYAWLAHLDFNRCQYSSMAESIEKCLDTIDADDGNATVRVSLVLGDAFLFSDQNEASRKWYEQARVMANRLGDQAAVGSITYNRAALRTAAARMKSLETDLGPSDISLVAAEVRSAVNYQAAARLSSLDHLLNSASIGIAMLEHRHAEASLAIQKLLESAVVPGGTAELAILYADQAHCLAHSGNFELSAKMALAAMSTPPAEYDADDRAMIFGALCKAAEIAGDTIAATRYRNEQIQASVEHRATIAHIRALLGHYVSGPATELSIRVKNRS